VIPSVLSDWVAGFLGKPVDSVTAIGSGASRQIWLINGAYVLRVDPGTGPVAGTALNLARESVIYRALADTDLPVPTLHAVSPDGCALLMEYIEGADALAAVADPSVRRAVGRDYFRCLGRMHLLDVGSLDLPGIGGAATASGGTLADLDLWSSICEQRTRRWCTPAVGFALSWLRASLVSSVRPAALCHGDAGPGNFLFADGAVTAMLDWEFVHLGDPHDDLAWVAVRNHLLGQPIEMGDGFGVWRDTTGMNVNARLVEYYRVFVLTRMAISCDASLAWKDGVEDESIRTQVLLRPWLGTAITTALGFAGCHDPGLAAVQAAAQKNLDDSPYASLLTLIPPLEPIGIP
jgi:prepilin-type processing-associated H-X9-DG protein